MLIVGQFKAVMSSQVSYICTIRAVVHPLHGHTCVTRHVESLQGILQRPSTPTHTSSWTVNVLRPAICLHSVPRGKAGVVTPHYHLAISILIIPKHPTNSVTTPCLPLCWMHSAETGTVNFPAFSNLNLHLINSAYFDALEYTLPDRLINQTLLYCTTILYKYFNMAH